MNMEPGRGQLFATEAKTDLDDDDTKQGADGVSVLDEDTEFASKNEFISSNGVDCSVKMEPSHTSSPIASHVQKASASGVRWSTDESVQSDLMSTPVAESHSYSHSDSRHLTHSAGDTNEPAGASKSSTESFHAGPDTPIVESFHTPGVDDSMAYFTASEDSTFVVKDHTTIDLPSGHDEQATIPAALVGAELEKLRDSPADNNEELDINAVEKFEGSEGGGARRPAEDVQLPINDDHLQLQFECDQDLSLPTEAKAALSPKAAVAPTVSSDDAAQHDSQVKTVSEELPSNRTDLDLRLLEMICEEATSMTIKEALIHSLNPSVRAGLQDGKLFLSETEVLSLERYCESVIDNLITELLEQRWPQGSESLHTFNMEEKKEKALQLSEVGLRSLQKSCGQLARDIISESIGDSSILLIGSSGASGGGRLEDESAESTPQSSAVQELLTLFQNSKAVQQYIGDLTASVISSAVNKVVISSTNGLGQKGGQVNGHIPNDDLQLGRASASLSFAEEDEQDVSSGHSETSDGYGRGEFDLHEDSAAELDMGQTLEYDAEWDRGDVLQDLQTFAPGGKQKIIVRELSFDERAEVAKIDLLAPVFLAVTEDSDEESDLRVLRRKAQSIENLCGVIEERVAPIRRCRSSSIPTSRRAARRSQRAKEAEDDTTERAREAQGEGESSRAERREESTAVQPDEQPARDWRWYTVSVNSRDKVLDLDMLTPYMKVISHGGRAAGDRSTIVVLSACYLPPRGQRNYDYLMEQLYFYVISTLELLATDEDYHLVYFNASTAQNRPSTAWMRRFYQQIERGLKKRMRAMYVVHPNFWLKTVITFAKPFLSSHFWRKLHFVHTLDSLSAFVPVDYIFIPDEVMRADPNYRRLHNL